MNLIQSFRDDATADLFRERNTRAARRIPRELWRVVQRKLKLLDASARLDDLAIPAGNRLELLKGGQARRHSICIRQCSAERGRRRKVAGCEGGKRTRCVTEAGDRVPVARQESDQSARDPCTQPPGSSWAWVWTTNDSTTAWVRRAGVNGCCRN